MPRIGFHDEEEVQEIPSTSQETRKSLGSTNKHIATAMGSLASSSSSSGSTWKAKQMPFGANSNEIPVQTKKRALKKEFKEEITAEVQDTRAAPRSKLTKPADPRQPGHRASYKEMVVSKQSIQAGRTKHNMTPLEEHALLAKGKAPETKGKTVTPELSQHRMKQRMDWIWVKRLEKC